MCYNLQFSCVMKIGDQIKCPALRAFRLDTRCPHPRETNDGSSESRRRPRRVRDAYLYLSLSQPQSVLLSLPPPLQLLSPSSLFSQQHCGVEGYDELIACGARSSRKLWTGNDPTMFKFRVLPEKVDKVLHVSSYVVPNQLTTRILQKFCIVP